MLKNVTKTNPASGGGANPEPTVAQELLEAIRLATQEFKSCEVVTDLRRAEKFLKNCRYTYKPYQKGILLSFEKANIYIHNP